MSIIEILKTSPELAANINVTTKASELFELYKMWEAEKKEKPEPKDPEEYLTPAEYAEVLKISLVTLWSWDKKGITIPLRIGNKKLYRRSDLEKILCND